MPSLHKLQEQVADYVRKRSTVTRQNLIVDIDRVR